MVLYFIGIDSTTTELLGVMVVEDGSSAGGRPYWHVAREYRGLIRRRRRRRSGGRRQQAIKRSIAAGRWAVCARVFVR